VSLHVEEPVVFNRNAATATYYPTNRTWLYSDSREWMKDWVVFGMGELLSYAHDFVRCGLFASVVM
jgi:hypothetical protein